MVDGSELRKVRSNSRVYHRYFLLDADMQSLRWEPSKKESDKAKIDVKSIKEVRTGKNTDTFRTNGSSDHISEDCAFSIIYGENYESLDLVANSADVANIWVTGLRYLISYGKHTLNMIQSSQDNMRASWLGDLFDEADVIGGRKCISLCSAVQLIKKLSPGVKNVKIELKFKELHKAKIKSVLTWPRRSSSKSFTTFARDQKSIFYWSSSQATRNFLTPRTWWSFWRQSRAWPRWAKTSVWKLFRSMNPRRRGNSRDGSPWMGLPITSCQQTATSLIRNKK